MSKENIKINQINGDSSETDNSSEKIDEISKNNKSKLKQISISDNRHKEFNTQKKIKTKKISDFAFYFLRFLRNVPLYFASFLNVGAKSIYFAILGSMISFVFAILLFPEQPGVFAVFFITLFLAPFVISENNINTLLIGRTRKIRNKGVTLINLKVKGNSNFSIIDFYEENQKLLTIYFFFFIGIMLVVTTLITIMPIEYSSHLFGQQGWLDSLIPARELGFEGVSKLPVFRDIFINNLSVIIVCFLISLVFPLGSMLLIVWNAIYWAVSFTQYAVFYSGFYGGGLAYVLLPLFLSIALHTILEAISYFFAIMSGSLVSTGLKQSRIDSDRFYYVFKYSISLLIFALIFLVLGVFAEVFIFDFLKNIFFSFF